MSTNKSVPYTIKTNGSIVVFLSSGCETVPTDHPNYQRIVDALKVGDFSNIEHLVNIAKAVVSYGNGSVAIKDGEIFYQGFSLHNTLTTRILKMMNEGFKFDHMMLFLNNLMQNPSKRAVNETYTFLENYGLPITDDGCFLAYKGVRADYKDIYSGTIDNSVGASPSMPRNMVDEDYERDCSTGLHVGALDYVVQYGHLTKGQPRHEGGNRLLIVKVNPKDVVSVPKYESHPKMRVSTYTVVSEILDVVKELDKVVYKADATMLAPDNKTNVEPSFPSTKEVVPAKRKVDTTSPFNFVKYDEGWDAAQNDIDAGAPYGTSRDYSEENSYRIGYNDCFNGRKYDNRARSVITSQAAPDAGTATNESEYSLGYTQGYEDAENGLDFQENLAIDATDSFKEGYSDGYHEYNNE